MMAAAQYGLEAADTVGDDPIRFSHGSTKACIPCPI